MNLADLPAALEKNKTAAAGVGAVAVVGFALYQKRKNAGSTPPDAGAALSAGSQTAAASGGAAYDSTASDLYGALQPQLESLGRQLDQLQNPKTIPAPAQPHGTGLIPPPPKTTPKTPVPPKTIPRPMLPKSAPKQVVHKAPSPVNYTVKPGDSLSKIAARYPSKSITANTIYTANRQTIGPNKNLIKPDQKLVIK